MNAFLIVIISVFCSYFLMVSLHEYIISKKESQQGIHNSFEEARKKKDQLY